MINPGGLTLHGSCSIKLLGVLPCTPLLGWNASPLQVTPGILSVGPSYRPLNLKTPKIWRLMQKNLEISVKIWRLIDRQTKPSKHRS